MRPLPSAAAQRIDSSGSPAPLKTLPNPSSMNDQIQAFAQVPARALAPAHCTAHPAPSAARNSVYRTHPFLPPHFAVCVAAAAAPVIWLCTCLHSLAPDTKQPSSDGVRQHVRLRRALPRPCILTRALSTGCTRRPRLENLRLIRSSGRASIRLKTAAASKPTPTRPCKREIL